MVIIVAEKHPKQWFIQVKLLSLVVEVSNTARFDVILTSVTIIKQVFLRKLFCYDSLSTH